MRIVLSLLAAFLIVYAINSQSSWGSVPTLKEPEFSSLYWGMNQATFRKVYPRKAYEAQSKPGYAQDLFLTIYGHQAITGFDFGQNDRLRRIVGSYVFESLAGKRLNRNDILKQSEQALSGLRRAYGKPVLSIPWDGSTLVHIWVRPADLIQLGWNGGDAWGIHYRSRAFDPDVPQILEFLRSQGVKF